MMVATRALRMVTSWWLLNRWVRERGGMPMGTLRYLGNLARHASLWWIR